IPKVPGSLLDIMHDHAGTVMGGVVLFIVVHAPRSINSRKFGNWSRHFPNTNDGSAQSRPITRIFSTEPMFASFFLRQSHKAVIPPARGFCSTNHHARRAHACHRTRWSDVDELETARGPRRHADVATAHARRRVGHSGFNHPRVDASGLDEPGHRHESRKARHLPFPPHAPGRLLPAAA